MLNLCLVSNWVETSVKRLYQRVAHPTQIGFGETKSNAKLNIKMVLHMCYAFIILIENEEKFGIGY